MTPSAPPAALELLTEVECVRRIPGRDTEVRAWLRSLAGVRRKGPTGMTLYVWSDVVARMPSADVDDTVEEPPQPQAPAYARRATLVSRP